MWKEQCEAPALWGRGIIMVSLNETKTEGFVRKHFEKQGALKIEQKKSDNQKIQRLLECASKKRTGRIGMPDFIIQFIAILNLVIIIECKADKKNHESKTGNQPAKYAVDGAKWYASFLAVEYNVIAIAVSGEENCKSSTYFFAKGGHKVHKLKTDKLLSTKGYIKIFRHSPVEKSKAYKNLLKSASDLHNYIRDYGGLSEAEKPVLIAGILISLLNEPFKSGFEITKTDQELARLLYNAVKTVLTDANISDYKIKSMMYPIEFIKVHPTLATRKVIINKRPLISIIQTINKHVAPFIMDYQDIDVIAQFYGEFLKYTAGDKKGLGIVLTPKHICELMINLIDLTKDSKVLDICVGTAGFLIAAQNKMIELAGDDYEKIEEIKKTQLIGIEKDPHMYFLGCSNMLLRGDGRANMFRDSCFNMTKKISTYKPNAGVVNPPYSQKGKGLEELSFVKYMLDQLESGSLGTAIFKITCGLDYNILKEEILKSHTLLAVMSMPEELFYPVGVVTIIAVFKAKHPHPKDYKTWFGYWRDDGFKKTKNLGRVDGGSWDLIRKEWLDSYKDRGIVHKKSALRVVTAHDEWCAEAYINFDDSTISNEYFSTTIKELFSYRAKIQQSKGHVDLETVEWKLFKYGDLFNIEQGKGKVQAVDAKKQKTGVRYISARTRNNGQVGYVNGPADYNGNVITVANSGQGSVGFTFYQETPFCALATVNILIPKFKLNKFIAMFLVPLIKSGRPKYSFGRRMNLDRFRGSTIRLPVDGDGEPDWEFMEQYIKAFDLSNKL